MNNTMNFEETKKYIEDNLMYFNYTYLKTCKVYIYREWK